MAEEFSSRHKAILVKLLHAAKSKVSANSLIAELQRQKEKFPKKSLETILLDVAKVDKLAGQIFKEQQKDFKSELLATECLQRFLSTYEKLKYSRKVSGRQNIDTIEEDEETSMHQKSQNESAAATAKPVEPNGNVTGLPRPDVKEIPTIVVIEATEDFSKSAQIPAETSTPALISTSALHESLRNNNISSLATNGSPHSRLFFSKAVMDSLPPQGVTPNCAARSVTEQERIVIEDLLYCFIGLPGDFITPQLIEENDSGFTRFSFKISDQVDISLRNIAQDLLPMASNYSIVQKFAQWADKVKNQILQALSEVLQTILNDYRLSITQLEKEMANNNLTLHKLHYLIRPNGQKLDILSELVGKISKSDLKSGTILTLLYDEITFQTGDAMSQRMLIELTERASMPYIEMLERWILKGVIIDPFNQFFVVDHVKELQNHGSEMDTARYWESRYTNQLDRIPRFLENDADIILRTGKYLNVIRQCGKQFSPQSSTSKLHFSAVNHNHSIFIKQAYHNASKTLLDLLVDENNLMGHISSVKRYFLVSKWKKRRRFRILLFWASILCIKFFL